MDTSKRAGLKLMVGAAVLAVASLMMSEPWSGPLGFLSRLGSILFLPLLSCDSPLDWGCMEYIGNDGYGLAYGFPTRFVLLAWLVVFAYGGLLFAGAVTWPLKRRQHSASP